MKLVINVPNWIIIILIFLGSAEIGIILGVLLTTVLDWIIK